MRLPCSVLKIPLLVALIGCSSMPIRSIPELHHKADVLVCGSASIIGCEEYKPKYGYEVDCKYRSVELADALRKTKLFTRVVLEEHDTDYLIELKPYVRYPYYHNIGHNPGIFVLSVAIPFWEQYEYGHDFSIRKRGELRSVRVNTLAKGTHIMWSGSIVINMFPARGIPGSFSTNETEYLKASILNALSNQRLTTCDLNKVGHAC